ncbi:MAG: hypothetical protein WBA46_18970 [Thermomicrobiales bacterium]
MLAHPFALQMPLSRRRILQLGVGAGLAAAAIIANLSSPIARFRRAGAQSAEPAFSSQIIDALGLPEVEIVHTSEGFKVPAAIAAGLHTVILRSETDLMVYADFMQLPAGLSLEEATPIALDAGGNDVVQPGWTFGGGNNVDPHAELRFVVDLPAGNWTIATSYYNESTPETMVLHPLTVGAGSPAATPVSSPMASPVAARPDGDLTMLLQDVAFGGIPETVPAGPTLVQVDNVGTQPRQMVLMRTPKALTSADFETMFAARNAGTPDPLWAQMVWVGYAALLSPGFTQWVEFDLKPGIYTATSWTIDPESGAPALLLGMVQSFTVA